MKAKGYSNLLYGLLAMWLMLPGCSNYLIQPNGAYRPKNAQFDLVRFTSNYQPNPQINNRYLYIATKSRVNPNPFSAKADTLLAYLGFFEDGRLIKGTVNQSQASRLLQQVNTHQSAQYIGYFISTGDVLHYEYFAHSSDGIGYYYKGNGKVSHDTIIDWYTDAGGIFRFDTLVVSPFTLKYDHPDE